jgi:hypothetical protein
MGSLKGIDMLQGRSDQPKWVAYAGCLFAIIWLGTFSYRYINPTSREDRAILSSLASHEILSIRIEPARHGYPSAVTRPTAIDDKQTIAAFSKALSRMSSRNPEHPKVTRAAILRIQFKDRVLGGYLEESSNDGTTFYCMSNVTSGWVFGTYSIPDGGALFDAIDQLATASTAPGKSTL